jgi:hypothetical protein
MNFFKKLKVFEEYVKYKDFGKNLKTFICKF